MISKDDAKYIASLSRIHLKDDEAETLTKNLEDILGYIKKLEDLDVTDVKPTSHAIQLKNVWREDKAEKSINREDALKIAVEHQNGSYKVPKVIE